MSVILASSVTTGAKVGRRDRTGKPVVTVEFDNGKGYAMSWQKADEIAARLRTSVRVMEVGDDVRLDMPGATHMLPLAGAVSLHAAIVAKARECEEQDKAESIVSDNALLFRAGAPIGLSSDPKIRDATIQEALHDRTLRLALPGGIRSKVLLNAPTIINHAPPPRSTP